MVCARCVSTVRTEMNRRAAISWFVWPSARQVQDVALAKAGAFEAAL
jgi:hypothetical protein